MSLDLSRALHAAVDGDDDQPLDLDLVSIGRQVRRRRHVRAGVRAGVGVAAAGAVAFTLPQVWGASSAARPAGLPGPQVSAGPGECGSRITRLALRANGEAALVAGSGGLEAGSPVLPTGGNLGTYVGSGFVGTAIEKVSASARDRVVEAAKAEAQAQLAAAQARLTELEAQVAALGAAYTGVGEQSTLEDQLSTAQMLVDSSQARIKAADTDGVLDGVSSGLGRDVQVLVVADGTIVATDRLPVTAQAGADRLDPATGFVSTVVDQTLTTCSEPGARGGDPLPAGRYEVYLGYGRDDEGTLTKAAGPWALTVERPAGPTGLPASFPRDLPLLPGRVATADADGNGWIVEILSDATDRVEAAGQLLLPLTPGGDTILAEDGIATGTYLGDGNGVEVTLADGTRWFVTVEDYRRGDGQGAVMYRITPDYTSGTTGP